VTGRGRVEVATVEVDGQAISLSSLDRVLWPRVGGTKRDLLRYMNDLGPVLLPHVQGHPLTLHRFPDGVEGKNFFQTRAPAHPPWVRAVNLTTPKAAKVLDVIVLDDLASLVWAANISAIELHPYLGTADDFERPTSVVFDLDPGAPADLVTCCDVALALHEVLDAVGLRSWPKVSGGKGLHVHVPVDGAGGYERTRAFAQAVAELLARQLPETVITNMNRAKRTGRVFIDWTQNHAWKSTIAPYSLRGYTYPTVAAPVTWNEVEQATVTRDIGPLMFLMGEIPGRLERHGDLMVDALDVRQALPVGL
jgi:bifunctional non-homologous end joining protein LigD